VRIGYRVKTTDDFYVHREPERVYADPKKPLVLSKADALRLMADWLDRGYIPRLFSVYVKIQAA
jgi:hypothetical protein